MSAHRRPLATAAAAGAVLCALWFVPSANATPDSARLAPQSDHATQQTGQQTGATSGAPETQTRMSAGDSSSEAAPYAIGGLAVLGAGGALLAGSLRRTRRRT